MRLAEYKEKYNLSYTEISEITKIPRTILCRACTDDNYCWKLHNAHVIVQWANGEISIEDLLPLEGDC